MFKIVFASRFFSMFKSANENDPQWWKDMDEEQQKKYLQDHPESELRLTPQKPAAEKSETGRKPFEMNREQIQQAIKEYQDATKDPTKSRDRERIFSKLYRNFTPMIMKKINDRTRRFNLSREQLEDMKSKANEIFIKALNNATPSSPGIISYIEKLLSNQLLGELRKVMEGDVHKSKPDVLTQIAAKEFILRHNLHPKSLTDEDFKHMARWINQHENHGAGDDVIIPTDEQIANMTDEDEIAYAKFLQAHPKSTRTRTDNATSESVQNALSTRVDSLDSPVGGGEDDARTLIDTLSDANLSNEDQKADHDELWDMIAKLDPESKQVMTLITQGYKPSEIADQMGLHTKKVLRIRNKVIKDMSGKVSDDKDDDEDMLDKHSAGDADMMRIANEISKFVKIIYVPETIVKTGNRYLVDNEFTLRRYASQLICDCGLKGCLHREAIVRWARNNEQ